MKTLTTIIFIIILSTSCKQLPDNTPVMHPPGDQWFVWGSTNTHTIKE